LGHPIYLITVYASSANASKIAGYTPGRYGCLKPSDTYPTVNINVQVKTSQLCMFNESCKFASFFVFCKLASRAPNVADSL